MTETYSIANPSHFNGTEPNLNQLETEITNSSIATAISHSGRTDDAVDIVFDSQISAGDQTTLTGLVSAHTPVVITPYTILGTITPRNTEFNNTSYIRIGSFTYPGTNYSDSITKISSIAYKDSGVTNYSIRVYDSKNDAEIASGTFSNTLEEVCDLTNISNLPSGVGKFEVHIKKTGGQGNKKVHIDSITFYSS